VVHRATTMKITESSLIETDTTYEELIDTLLVFRSGRLVSNSGPAHALILLCKFLEHAKNSVQIFSTGLALPDVYHNEQLLMTTKNSLRRGVKIDVIVQKELGSVPDSHFRRIFDDPRFHDQVSLRSCSSAPSFANRKENFSVMDSVAYRLEKDRTVPIASACMYDPLKASDLSDTFHNALVEIFKDTNGAKFVH
jgi:hypothetical protein